MLVEVREDGPNAGKCPYNVAKLCKPYIESVSQDGKVTIKLPFAILRNPVEKIIEEAEYDTNGIYLNKTSNFNDNN